MSADELFNSATQFNAHHSMRIIQCAALQC